MSKSEWIHWFFWSRFPLFWYWVHQKGSWIWSVLISENDVSDPFIDWIPCIGYARYHITLRRMVRKTGRNIYGHKLRSR